MFECTYTRNDKTDEPCVCAVPATKNDHHVDVDHEMNHDSNPNDKGCESLGEINAICNADNADAGDADNGKKVERVVVENEKLKQMQIKKTKEMTTIKMENLKKQTKTKRNCKKVKTDS